MTDLTHAVISVSTARCSYNLAATARAVEDGGAGKIVIFSLLKRGGRIYTKIIPDVSSATLFPVVAQKICLTASSIRTVGDGPCGLRCPTFLMPDLTLIVAWLMVA